MAEQRNIELFHHAHEAFDRGDHDAMRAWLADDFVWHEPGHNQLTGDYVGADELFGLFDRIGSLTDGRFSTELEDVVANDRHLVALLTLRASRGSKSIEMRRVNVYSVQPDGRVTERWGYVGDQAAFDDLFA
jgi:ketosteroid isomerase-like protein